MALARSSRCRSTRVAVSMSLRANPRAILLASAPRDPASAFVALGPSDFDAILCHEDTRIVARDDTVSIDRRTLQIGPRPGRRSCAAWTFFHGLRRRSRSSRSAMSRECLERPGQR